MAWPACNATATLPSVASTCDVMLQAQTPTVPWATAHPGSPPRRFQRLSLAGSCSLNWPPGMSLHAASPPTEPPTAMESAATASSAVAPPTQKRASPRRWLAAPCLLASLPVTRLPVASLDWALCGAGAKELKASWATGQRAAPTPPSQSRGGFRSRRLRAATGTRAASTHRGPGAGVSARSVLSCGAEVGEQR